MKEKRCSKCKTKKALNLFSKDKRDKKYGRQAWCKECNNLASKNYYATASEETKKKRAKYQKEYKKKNKKRIMEKQKIWRKNNRKALSKYALEWQKNNPDYLESRKEYSKEYRKRDASKKSHKKRNKEYGKRQIAFLGDTYIRNLLTKGTFLKASDIPISLVNAKREMLKLKREVEKKNETS